MKSTSLIWLGGLAGMVGGVTYAALGLVVWGSAHNPKSRLRVRGDGALGADRLCHLPSRGTFAGAALTGAAGGPRRRKP